MSHINRVETPIHRSAGQTDVAFLAGGDSRYILGAEILADGGLAEL